MDGITNSVSSFDFIDKYIEKTENNLKKARKYLSKFGKFGNEKVETEKVEEDEVAEMVEVNVAEKVGEEVAEKVGEEVAEKVEKTVDIGKEVLLNQGSEDPSILNVLESSHIDTNEREVFNKKDEEIEDVNDIPTPVNNSSNTNETPVIHNEDYGEVVEPYSGEVYVEHTVQKVDEVEKARIKDTVDDLIRLDIFEKGKFLPGEKKVAVRARLYQRGHVKKWILQFKGLLFLSETDEELCFTLLHSETSQILWRMDLKSGFRLKEVIKKSKKKAGKISKKIAFKDDFGIIRGFSFRKDDEVDSRKFISLVASLCRKKNSSFLQNIWRYFLPTSSFEENMAKEQESLSGISGEDIIGDPEWMNFLAGELGIGKEEIMSQEIVGAVNQGIRNTFFSGLEDLARQNTGLVGLIMNLLFPDEKQLGNTKVKKQSENGVSEVKKQSENGVSDSTTPQSEFSEDFDKIPRKSEKASEKDEKLEKQVNELMREVAELRKQLANKEEKFLHSVAEEVVLTAEEPFKERDRIPEPSVEIHENIGELEDDKDDKDDEIQPKSEDQEKRIIVKLKELMVDKDDGIQLKDEQSDKIIVELKEQVVDMEDERKSKIIAEEGKCTEVFDADDYAEEEPRSPFTSIPDNFWPNIEKKKSEEETRIINEGDDDYAEEEPRSPFTPIPEKFWPIIKKQEEKEDVDEPTVTVIEEINYVMKDEVLTDEIISQPKRDNEEKEVIDEEPSSPSSPKPDGNIEFEEYNMQKKKDYEMQKKKDTQNKEMIDSSLMGKKKTSSNLVGSCFMSKKDHLRIMRERKNSMHGITTKPDSTEPNNKSDNSSSEEEEEESSEEEDDDESIFRTQITIKRKVRSQLSSNSNKNVIKIVKETRTPVRRKVELSKETKISTLILIKNVYLKQLQKKFGNYQKNDAKKRGGKWVRGDD